jgi:hypothetical protein
MELRELPTMRLTVPYRLLAEQMHEAVLVSGDWREQLSEAPGVLIFGLEKENGQSVCTLGLDENAITLHLTENDGRYRTTMESSYLLTPSEDGSTTVNAASNKLAAFAVSDLQVFIKSAQDLQLANIPDLDL